MSRLAATFQSLKREGRTGLVAYLTCGFPRLSESRGLVRAMIEGGADIVEVGVPFSDPLADGRTIQRADEAALAQGVTLADCVSLVASLRHEGVETPMVLMGYYNPILAMGEGRFVDEAQRAGVDGVIVVDLPAEEAGNFRELCRGNGIDLIFLVAPTTSEARIAASAAAASGFIYCVSLAGTTGFRKELPADLANFMGRVRRHTDLPLAVGFGISTADHVQTVSKVADAVVIGTAIIDVIERAAAPNGEDGAATRCERLREYLEVVSGRRRANS